MSLPKKLKNFTVHNDGDNYVGQCKELGLPKLSVATEDYRGGGMLAPLAVDLGLEKLEMEETYGGMVVGVLRQMGAVRHDGSQLRFTGAYQDDQTGAVTTGELIVRGRPTEIDPGNASAGGDTEWKVKRSLSYLKWTIGGRVEVEIDVVNNVYIVGGVDRMAQIRAALEGDDNPLGGFVTGPQVNVPGAGGFGLGDVF